jgi:hypothetical protein
MACQWCLWASTVVFVIGVTPVTAASQKTPDEWKKEKEAAEAEAAAIEAQKKLIEAKLALAAAEVLAKDRSLQDLQTRAASAKASKDAAEAEKALADVRKANSDAQLAAFKASIGEVPSSGYQGTIDLKSEAGKLEASLLAAKAIQKAANLISDQVGKPKSAVKTILLCTAAELPKFDAWTTYTVQTSLVETAFATALELTAKAEGEEARESVPPAAAVGLALDATNKLLGYFRTDYAIGGFEFTLEDSLLADATAKALTSLDWDVRLPTRFNPEAPSFAESIFRTFTRLTALRLDAPQRQTQHEAEAGRLSGLASKETATDKRADLESAAARHLTAASAWKAAIPVYDGVFGKLTTADEKGILPLTTVLREAVMVQHMRKGSPLLLLKIHKSGGAYYTKKNLWTLFGGMPFYHMGGTVVSFVLMNGASGSVTAAGVVPVHGGFVKARRLQATIGTDGGP